MDNQTNLLAYYKDSEVRVTNERHPHYNALGKVVGVENSLLIVFRFDKQEKFYVQPTDLKITKR